MTSQAPPLVGGGVVSVRRASSRTVGSVTLARTWSSLEGLEDQSKLVYTDG